ncbi:hypothetical protein HDU86_007803 [Geranomyces michiganensis]|nr:hypothetical protein HDU86_007803 [Geranomyces michiganensis]
MQCQGNLNWNRKDDDDDHDDGLLLPLALDPPAGSLAAPAFKKLSRLNAVVRRFNARTVASPFPDSAKISDDDCPGSGNCNDDDDGDGSPVACTAVEYWSSRAKVSSHDMTCASSVNHVSEERPLPHMSENTTVDVEVLSGDPPCVPSLHVDSESEIVGTTTVDYFSRKEVLLENLYETLPGITLTAADDMSLAAETPAAVTSLAGSSVRSGSPSPLGRRSRRTATMTTTTTTTTSTSRSRSRSRDGRSVRLNVRKTTRKVTTVVLAAPEQDDGEDDLFFDADDAAWADILDEEASPTVPLRRPTTLRRQSTLTRPQALARRNSALPARKTTHRLLDPAAAAVRRESTLRRSFKTGGISDLEDEEDDTFLDALETLSIASGRSRGSSIAVPRRRTLQRRPTLIRVPTRISGSAHVNPSTTIATTTRKRLVVTTARRRPHHRHKPKPRTFFSTLCSRTGESLAHVATAATLASRPLGMLGVVDPGLVATAGAIAHAAGTNLVARFGRRDTQMRVQAVEGAAGAVSAAGVLERCGFGGWVGKTLGSGLEAALDGGVVAGVGGLLASGVAMNLNRSHSEYLSMAAEAIGHFGNVASLLPPELQAVAEAAGVMGTVLGGVSNERDDDTPKAICAGRSDCSDEEKSHESDSGSEDEDAREMHEYPVKGASTGD